MLKQNAVPYNIATPNNMGVVRYILAFSVLIAHFNELGGADIPFPLTSYSAVGGFFALSGFLVYGSYLKRPSPRSYLKARARRILPAYFTTVLLAALLLAPLSTLPLSDYFSSSGFWRYLGANLSFLNFLGPDLPGVFTSNHAEAVNGSLWTMKIEWFLYFSVPIVAWLSSKIKWKPLLIFILIYLLSATYRIIFYELYLNTEREIWYILSRQFLGQLMYFYSGVIFYYYYDSLMRNSTAILAVSLLVMIAGNYWEIFSMLLQPFAIASLVIIISMTGKWGQWEYKQDNISYNIYLLHAPIIQACVALGLTVTLPVPVSFLIVVVATIGFAVLVNRIEKPFQKKKSQNSLVK